MSTANAFMWFAGDVQKQGNWRAGRWFAMCSVNTFKLGRTRVASLPARWFEENLGNPV